MNRIAGDFLNFILAIIVTLVVVSILHRAQIAWRQQRVPGRRSHGPSVTKIGVIIAIGGIAALLFEVQKCHWLGVCR